MVATAAVVVGDYQFDDNLNNSAGGGFTMSTVGGTGSYSTDTPFGESKTVHNLTGAQGLTIDTSGLTTQSSYTLVMDINTVEVNSYNALFHVDTNDDLGFYLLQEDIYYYNSTLQTSSDFVQANQWHRFAVSRDTNGTVRLYGSEAGSSEVTLRDSGIASAAEPIVGNSIQLFKDNGSENFNLSVSQVWLADGVMTQAEINEYVSGEGGPPSSSAAIPEPSSVALLLLGSALVRGVRVWRRA